MRILGLDPGLRHTGWGIIDMTGSHLRHVADGVVDSDSSQEMVQRLLQIFEGVTAVISQYMPGEVAVEEIFVNRNPASTLKLGQARGIVLLASAQAGIPVAEYAPNLVKKSVVGSGHAAKEQVAMMVHTLLPGSKATEDAADALAVAICHAHHATTTALWQERSVARGRS